MVPVFAALGDSTRLAIVQRLGDGRPRSISALREGTPHTRQAIARHLQVLQEAGLLHDHKRGREHLYALDPRPLREVVGWADQFRALWEERLNRREEFLTQGYGGTLDQLCELVEAG
jgi:DNA-binding transcriptional ArsR family regulator